MNQFIYSLLSTLLATGVFAQQQPVYNVMTYPSPRGIYVQVTLADTNDLYKKAQSFAVRRTEKGTDSDQGRLVGTLRPTTSAAQFEDLVGSAKYNQFVRTFGFTSKADVDRFLTDPARRDARQLLSATDITFSRGLGEVFLDTEVKPGGFYGYRVVRLDKAGVEQEVDRRVVLNQANPAIRSVKTDLRRIVGTDSAVRFSWNVSYPPIALPTDPASLSVNSFAELKAVALQRPALFSTFPVGALNTTFAVYYRLNNEARWRFLEKYTATADSAGQFYTTARIGCKPDDVVETRLIPEDYAGNQGDTSAVARGVAVTNSKVEYIYGLNSRDTTSAIYLWWKKLSAKPYYSGIELSRTSANTAPKVLAILPVDATSYTDPDVYPAGELFTYSIRPLFVPFQDLKQEIPAMTAQSCTKFRRPTPAFNLRVDTTGRLPRLVWDTADDKSGYAFHVYRGQSPTDMAPIGLPVKAREFVDSANFLSPRVTYFYAVQAMNLTQDVSVLSAYITYRPTVAYAPVEFSSPNLIQHEIINNDAFLSWSDMRLNDNYIQGYTLQRKRQSEPDRAFRTLHAGTWTQPSFTDTTFVLGVAYVYRVASMGLSGERGQYSLPVSVYGNPVASELPAIEEVSLVNMSTSIRVSWPPVEPGGIVGYRVVRREPTQRTFTTVGKLSQGTFDFNDQGVKPGKTYVYAVQSIGPNKQESPIRTTRSIYRQATR